MVPFSMFVSFHFPKNVHSTKGTTMGDTPENGNEHLEL